MQRWIERGVLSAVGLVFMLMMAFGAREQVFSGQNDFVPLYNGARLAGTGDLYNPERNYELLEQRTGGFNASLRYTRPPHLSVLLWPLGGLPYHTAYVIWTLLSICALAGFVALWRIPSPPDAMMLTALSLPAWQAVMNGQDTPYLLLWLALTVELDRRKRPFLGGMALALCGAKFHLFVLVPVWLLAQRRWRMLQGLAAGAAVLLVISFASAGAGWPLTYAQTLLDNRVHPGAHIMPNLHGLVYGLPRAFALEIAGSALVAAATWFATRRATLLEGLAVTLTGGLLVSYHAYLSDCTVLLPAAALVYAQNPSRPMQLMAALILTPFVYFLLIADRPYPYFVQALVVLFFVGLVWITAGQRKPAREPAPQPV